MLSNNHSETAGTSRVVSKPVTSGLDKQALIDSTQTRMPVVTDDVKPAASETSNRLFHGTPQHCESSGGLSGHQNRRRMSCTHCIKHGLFNALLRRAFYHYGLLVAKYAPVIIFVTLLCSLNAIGLIRMRLEDRVRDGFTPIGSPSFREYEIYKDFMGTDGDPMFTVAIVRAQDNGSMVRLPHLQSTVNFAEFIMRNFSIKVDAAPDAENQTKRIVRFADLCDSYCEINQLLALFLDAYKEQKRHIEHDEPLNANINLSYPMATFALPMPVELSMFRVFRQVEKYPSYESSTTPRITDIKHVSLILLVFRADKTMDKIVNGEDIIAKWEREAYLYVRDVYNDPYVRIDVVGNEILNGEIIRGGRATIPFFAVGFVIMSVFVLISVIGSALYYNQMDAGKFLVAGGTILSPMLAVASTMGFTSFLGLRINSMTLVVPFLVMAIGVDDAFLMIHSWQRFALQKGNRLHPVADRLGWVLEDVGPSITITSITNCLAFGIGAMTPTPEIRLFARTAAIAMAIDFFFEITFFASCLALSAKWEKQIAQADIPDFKDEIRRKIQKICGSILRAYSKFVNNSLTAVVTLGLVIVYWVFILMGAIRIEARLDGQKLLPQDSPLKEVDRIMTTVVWSEHHPVSIVINHKLNATNSSELVDLLNMVHEFESMHHAIGPASTILWLRDYKKYYADMQESHWFLDAFGITDYDDTNETSVGQTKPPDEWNLSWEYLDSFLEERRYKHHKADIRWSRNKKGQIEVNRFLFTTIYRNTSDWSTRVELMQHWRQIANKYAHLNASVFEAASHFIDQILSLKTVTVTSVIVTFVCMAIVCAVFIPSPCSVVCASWAIAAISIGTFGFLSWWGMDLDPVVMSATLMTVGLSVDFTAHTSYHYQHTGKHHDDTNETPCRNKLERLERTLGSVAWPMTQAGLSTIMCVVPLVLLKSYAPEVFVKSIVLVVLWGLVHGLLVLPVFLSALPNCMTGAGCCEHEHTRDWHHPNQGDETLFLQITTTNDTSQEDDIQISVGYTPAAKDNAINLPDSSRQSDQHQQRSRSGHEMHPCDTGVTNPPRSPPQFESHQNRTDGGDIMMLTDDIDDADRPSTSYRVATMTRSHML